MHFHCDPWRSEMREEFVQPNWIVKDGEGDYKDPRGFAGEMYIMFWFKWDWKLKHSLSLISQSPKMFTVNGAAPGYTTLQCIWTTSWVKVLVVEFYLCMSRWFPQISFGLSEPRGTVSECRHSKVFIPLINSHARCSANYIWSFTWKSLYLWC